MKPATTWELYYIYEVRANAILPSYYGGCLYSIILYIINELNNIKSLGTDRFTLIYRSLG